MVTSGGLLALLAAPRLRSPCEPGPDDPIAGLAFPRVADAKTPIAASTTTRDCVANEETAPGDPQAHAGCQARAIDVV